MHSEYLPKHFWYHGMNKIKGGKGYRDGRPVGVIGGPCHECTGDIIKLQMNTSSKGFETTSEKVCNECGLVEGGPFMIMETHTVLEPPHLNKHKVKAKEEDLALRKYYNEDGEEIYNKRRVSIFDIGKGLEKHIHEVNHPTGKPTIEQTMYDNEYEYYYATHELWRENQEEPKGLPTLQDTELRTNDNGEAELPEPLMDIYDWTNKEINTGYKMKRLNNPKRAVLNRRPDEERMAYEVGQQKRYADVVATTMHLNRLQRDQVEYVIDNYGIQDLHRQAPYEDIIEHLCLYIMSLSIKPQRFSVYVREYKRYNSYNKRLYQVIKEKLGNVPI